MALTVRQGLTLFCAGLIACAQGSGPGREGDPGAGQGLGPGTPGTGAAGDPVPWTPLPPAAAVGKVKLLLLGLPPSDEEVAAVAGDPAAMRGLIDQWMQRPEYWGKMRAFFGTAFQQTQVTSGDFGMGQFPVSLDGRVLNGFLESFARTAVQLVQEGRSFTEVVTTRRFMVTPALMSAYAVMDLFNTNDNGGRSNAWLKANPSFQWTQQFSRGPIPLSESLDPASPNYLVFYSPRAGAFNDANCPREPYVWRSQTNWPDPTGALYQFLMGINNAFNVRLANGSNYTCNVGGENSAYSYLTGPDFTNWQMVTIRQPRAGEATTKPWDLFKLRAGTELVFNTIRTGFFTTPAFLAGWNTNAANSMRVTTNQTMIVALGKAIALEDNTPAPVGNAIDQVHATPGSACFGCHQSLDPLRQYFRRDFSYNFSPQLDSKVTAVPASFGFQGVTTSTNGGVVELAQRLVAHPRFASAWVQKLCWWANSAACSESDPEFQRVAAAFSQGGFQWPVLLRELLSSPLVTYSAPTQASAEEQAPIARRDHLCAALSLRLNYPDICGLTTSVPSTLRTAQVVASVLPSDGYARGDEEPVLATDPSLITRTGMENLCISIANTIVENGTSSRFRTSDVDGAIRDFVRNLMGLTTARSATPISILRAHYDQALAVSGSSSTMALRSAFVVACTSPLVVGLGQ